MKIIDNAAGFSGARHSKTNVVTASIDKISFHYPVFIGDLLITKSCINMVGNSSMEIGVRVESENIFTGQKKHIASAYLTFVALDEQGKPKKIHPLIFETSEEKRRNEEAISRKKIRVQERIKEEEHQKAGKRT